VEFFASPADALRAGYRPCKRCRPMSPRDEAPAWVVKVLDMAEKHAGQRLTAADLRAQGVDPVRAARYFKAHFGMTFQAYHRLRRLGGAMRHLRDGAGVTRAQQRAGYESARGFRESFARIFGEAPSRAGAGERTVLHVAWITTPIGPMIAAASVRGLCMLEFVDRRGLQTQIDTLRKRFPGVIAPGASPHLSQIERELGEYFAGVRTEFTVPIDAPGTPFQERVWEALRRIPAGATRSYAQVARDIGAPQSVRAVARANGDNRVAILTPCHRVIGSDGSLTGYAGGLERKRRLLEMEGAETRGGE
jgi:AraC family transcriptional regulator of adaptative response/methylated-DNA-[protein]-cysteine methyltransferase